MMEMETRMKVTVGWIAAMSALVSLGIAGCGQDSPTDEDGGGGSPSKDDDAGRKPETDAGGGTSGSGGGGGGDDELSLLPWASGNTWTYRVTGDGTVGEKVTTVGALEKVGGDGPHADEMAFKVETKKGAMDQTISWQVEIDGKVVRLREQSFSAKTGALELEETWDPYKLHVDNAPAHRKIGASWLEEYDETKMPAGKTPTTVIARDRWTVNAVNESVTVPAGTFDAIVLQKAGGSNLKLYWYVPGVGKVKETGGQTEELLSYEVAP